MWASEAVGTAGPVSPPDVRPIVVPRRGFAYPVAGDLPVTGISERVVVLQPLSG